MATAKRPATKKPDATASEPAAKTTKSRTAATTKTPTPEVTEPKVASTQTPAPEVQEKKAAPAPEMPVPTRPTLPALSSAQKWQMVAEAAYYRAEKRGFAQGHQDEDWFAAEREIERLVQRLTPPATAMH